MLFEALRRAVAAGAVVPEATAAAVFGAAWPVCWAEDVLGQWAGGSLLVQHAAHAQLTALNWCGKNFWAADDVAPLVVRSRDGGRRESSAMGRADLVRHRGTVAMRYRDHAVVDDFRWVAPDTLMGRLVVEGAPDYFFWLQRVAGVQRSAAKL